MTADGNRRIVMGDHAKRRNIRTDQPSHQFALHFNHLLYPPRFTSRISPHPLSGILPQSPTLVLSFPICTAVHSPSYSLQVLLRLKTHSGLHLHSNLPPFSPLHYRPQRHSRLFDLHDLILPDSSLRPTLPRQPNFRPLFGQRHRLKCSKTSTLLRRWRSGVLYSTKTSRILSNPQCVPCRRLQLRECLKKGIWSSIRTRWFNGQETEAKGQHCR